MAKLPPTHTPASSVGQLCIEVGGVSITADCTYSPEKLAALLWGIQLCMHGVILGVPTMEILMPTANHLQYFSYAVIIRMINIADKMEW